MVPLIAEYNLLRTTNTCKQALFYRCAIIILGLGPVGTGLDGALLNKSKSVLRHYSTCALYRLEAMHVLQILPVILYSPIPKL